MVKEIHKNPFWTVVIPETALGSITCAASETGLAAVSFTREFPASDAVDLDAGEPSSFVRKILQEVMQQLSAYLEGDLKQFDLPIDWSVCTDFQQKVLQVVSNIPYGQVLTYSQVAVLLGDPKLLRAVGGSVGRNPMPLVIPCHRVVSPKGHLRGYSGRGGVKTKAWLLQMEGHFLVTEKLD